MINFVYDHPWLKSFNLTNREIDVLACLTEHQASKKIARILDVQVRTVETHVFNIMQKLDKHSRISIVDCLLQSACACDIVKHNPAYIELTL